MAPIVVKFQDKYGSKKPETSRAQRKMLRTGKPISAAQLRHRRQMRDRHRSKKPQTKEDADNMKQDLELQRLLDESHIFNGEKPRFSGAELSLESAAMENAPIGSSRVRTLSSRMHKLSETNGRKKHRLENIPMNMRKGMVKAQVKRIGKYEEEAREAGIVLAHNRKGQFRKIHDSTTTSFTERIGTGFKRDMRLRDRGLKINSVGKATGEGVFLSKRDLERIRGEPSRGRGSNRRRRH